jgi:hypothetical protein
MHIAASILDEDRQSSRNGEIERWKQKMWLAIFKVNNTWPRILTIKKIRANFQA